MSNNKYQKEPPNYLVNGQAPERSGEQFYQKDKILKEKYGEVWGAQTHSRRRKLILQKHPQVAQLLIPDKPYSIILTIILVPLAMWVIYLVKDSSWPVFLSTVYIFGGTINHTLHVLIHDFTHWGGHKSLTVNKIMAIICNIPMGAPSALPFGKYHSDHHNFLGEDGKDPDLPMLVQSNHIKTCFGKFCFVLSLSIVYALRPVLFMPKKLWASQWINYIVIICTDLLIWKYWGNGALLYLVIGAYLSIGPHPAAMHVLAQHYEFTKGLQTYDYFGIWNFFNLNLGYHIEHHDFPTCPWYNLPKIRAAAPQFYQYLPHHTSYTKVALKFIFDNNFNLFNRTLRYLDKKSI